MYVCSNCGYKSLKWLGKCPNCGMWNTFTEESEEPSFANLVVKKQSKPVLLKDAGSKKINRAVTNIEEFNKVLGGGFVKGEVVLLGGAPGIGKSTFLLQVASSLGKNSKVLYVSAEESIQQISLRSQRLKCSFENVYIVNEDNLEKVYDYVKELAPDFLIVDSIQVVFFPQNGSQKGTVTQLKQSANFLTQIAKALDITVIIVGHVTKEGVLSGPKLLEHIVDCVLYFEGEKLSHFRILRAVKNRFGATGEIGVFEMTHQGLREAKSLQDIFIPHQSLSVSGSSITCAMEGIRPLLIEIQALVSKASFGVVRRRAQGFDFNRFSLLVAMAEKRMHYSLGSEDIFLNVAGGIKLNDPAADLAVIIAVISSFEEKPVKPGIVFIGEVGLGGELRAVSSVNLRLAEAQRLGFKECFIPQVNLKDVDKGKISSLKINGEETVKNVLDKVFS